MCSVLYYLFLCLFLNSVYTTVNPQEYAPVVEAATYIITIAGIGSLSVPVAIIGTAALTSFVARFLYENGADTAIAKDFVHAIESDFNKKKQKSKTANVSSSNASSPAPQDPKKPEKPNKEKEFFERLKEKSNKKARTLRFGMMYRDPDTKLWWSRDTGGHGGSSYKVFREGARGFDWAFDADMLGNRIIGKHKGPIGTFILYKEVIFLP